MAATFEVDDTGALIWVYAERSRRAHVRLEDADGALVAEVGPIELAPDRGNTGAVIVDILAPDTPYRYHVELEHGMVLGPYHVRTAPAADADIDVHFTLSADIDVSDEFASPIFDTMSASGASFFISMGDWPYADNHPPSFTIDEFRARHREVRAPNNIRDMLRALPVYATWDDHEARNNWDGRFREEEASRIANAITVWDEFFPLRTTLAGEDRRWRSIRWGRHLELFIVDTRCCRSANLAADGPDKTMLGAPQLQWLIDAVAASEATFKLVITSVALIAGDVDTWTSFATERETLLTALAAQEPSGLLFLTGNGHRFSAHVLPSWGVREFMVGPLARHPAEPEPLGPEVLASIMGYNYGEVEIRAQGPDNVPSLIFVARDADGEELYRERFNAQDLVLTVP